MDKGMYQSKDYKFIPMTSLVSRTGFEVTHDVYYYTDQIVNIIFIGDPVQGDWTLVDTGLPYAAEEIKSVVDDRFGGKKPKAIILTHGHFDHVGGVVDLVEEWEVPVYAHELEFPYLTGEKSYPEPDSTVEGGLLAKISPMYPNEPINIKPVLKPLPQDQSVPNLDGWEWIHTPGHSPGQVSLFREEDGLLIAADAFITVKQDSFYNVLMQNPEINGPPRYLTTDWHAARDSVKKLAAVRPKIAITGHGPMLEGGELEKELAKLVESFDEIAIPDYGRFVDE